MKLSHKKTVIGNLKRKLKRSWAYKKVPLPRSMQLEVANACNFRCKMCPAHGMRSKGTRKVGFMDWDLFRKIVDEAAEEFPGMHIIPQGAGESFMHPKFPQMLGYLKAADNFRIGFNTNGALLNEKLMNLIVDLEIDDFGFSIDAFDAETFKDITGKDSYEKVKANVHRLREIKSEKKASRPRLRVLMVEMDENRDKIDNYLDYWLQFVDEAVIQMERVENGRTAADHYIPETKREPCMHLWNTVFVQWDGDMVICCDDWESRQVLGNLKDTTIRSLWYGDKMKEKREIHLKGQFDKIDICEECCSWVDKPFRLYESDDRAMNVDALVKTYRKKSESS